MAKYQEGGGDDKNELDVSDENEEEATEDEKEEYELDDDSSILSFFKVMHGNFM